MVVLKLKKIFSTAQQPNRVIRFKKKSKLYSVLSAEFNIKRHMLTEEKVWLLLCAFGKKSQLNRDILCLDMKMQRILKTKFLHKRDVVEILKPHLNFEEDISYKKKLRYQNSRTKDFGCFVDQSEIFEQLKIKINRALVIENKNTPFIISDQFYQSLIKIKTFQINLPYYPFFYIRQIIGQYIVDNQDRLVDIYNNKIAHVGRDTLFNPFNIDILHVSQLDDFIYLHLKPYKFLNLSNYCEVFYKLPDH